jgi:hypothetical protein
MAGNVSGLHVFTADVGPEALSLLDGNYSALVTALNTLANFSNYYVDTGGTNALVVTTIGSQVFSYVDGVVLEIKVANSSTVAAPTLNVNGLGTRPIINTDGSSLLSGAMLAGGRYHFIYNADVASFVLQNPTIGIGAQVVKVKPLTTSRSNTTTMTDDPDLLVALFAGTYEFDLFINPYGTTTTTQGVQINLNFNNTFTTNYIQLLQGQGSPTAPYVTSLNVQTAAGNGPFVPAAFGTSATGGFFIRMEGMITTTATGLFALAWAQNSSNANATNIGLGSYMKITRLA